MRWARSFPTILILESSSMLALLRSTDLAIETPLRLVVCQPIIRRQLQFVIPAISMLKSFTQAQIDRDAIWPAPGSTACS